MDRAQSEFSVGTYDCKLFTHNLVSFPGPLCMYVQLIGLEVGWG